MHRRVFSEEESSVRDYIQKEQLTLEVVSNMDFKALNLATTPSIVLVDSNGSIVDFWIGKLLTEAMQQIIRLVREHKS